MVGRYVTVFFLSYCMAIAFGRFDWSKVASGSNYPICSRLSALFAQQSAEEKRKYTLEQTYQTWLDAGQLNCGVERVGWGLLEKKHNERWLQGCIAGILPAKRRLLGFMQDLCRDQTKANVAFRNSSSSFSTVRSRSRGVIFTGKGEHFKDIFQSIWGLRIINVTLPVEIWVNSRDSGVCGSIFHAPGNGGGVCEILPDSVSGFASKFYALLSTKLEHVLFIDADNLAARDVNELFNSPEFLQRGAIIWPDLWGDACRALSAYGQTNGWTGFRSHVLWMAQFGGLLWDGNDRDKVQESEAGQIVYDLTRHGGLLELARRFIEDRLFLKRVVNGDKDIFRFVHMMMGEPFTYARHLPGYSVVDTPNYGRDCLTQYWGGDDAQSPGPMFFHQLKTRDPDAFLMSKRVDHSLRSAPSACVDLGGRPGQAPLVFEKHADGEGMRLRAQRLFHHVDARWEAGNFPALLWWHEWSLFITDHFRVVVLMLMTVFLTPLFWSRRTVFFANCVKVRRNSV